MTRWRTPDRQSIAHAAILLALLAGLLVILMIKFAHLWNNTEESSTPAPSTPSSVPRQLHWRVETSIPHDSQAFTQGLEMLTPDVFVESTGLKGRSQVRRTSAASGRVLAQTDLPATQFGEGITRVGNELVSLTWKDRLVHRWDASTLRLLRTQSYDSEGWGICYDHRGKKIWTSDGSGTLTARDPRTLKTIESIPITIFSQETKQPEPLDKINELECVDGKIWANLWMQNVIVRIDSATADVDAFADLSQLTKTAEDDQRAKNLPPFDDDQVLNGLAWNAGKHTMWVTGKQWPRMYELKLEE